VNHLFICLFLHKYEVSLFAIYQSITAICFLYRSTGALSRGGGGKQKISFSRKFPFMKTRNESFADSFFLYRSTKLHGSINHSFICLFLQKYGGPESGRWQAEDQLQPQVPLHEVPRTLAHAHGLEISINQ
jgi:hypothetical protein